MWQVLHEYYLDLIEETYLAKHPMEGYRCRRDHIRFLKLLLGDIKLSASESTYTTTTTTTTTTYI
jgi:hypothetical protein